MLSTIDVINNVLTDTVEERHWKLIAKRIGCKLERDHIDLKLKTLMEIIKEAKEKYKEENKTEFKIEEWIKNIAKQAVCESQLSKDVKEIRKKWESLHLTTNTVGSKILLAGTEILFETMNECMISLQNILSDEYAAPLRDEAEQLYRNISKVEEILDEMVILEKKIKTVDDLLTKEEFKAQSSIGTKFEEALKAWTEGRGEVDRSTTTEES